MSGALHSVERQALSLLAVAKARLFALKLCPRWMDKVRAEGCEMRFAGFISKGVAKH
jgi:hypothetical protein